MILVTYGFHRNEGTAWLIGYILEQQNKDEFIKFKDLSQYHDRSEEGLCKEIIKECKKWEKEGEKIDAIFDIHRGSGSTVKYRKNLTTFCIGAAKHKTYSKKLDNFLIDVYKWAENLKRYSALPLFRVKEIFWHRKDFERTNTLGEYGNGYISCEIGYWKDDSVEDLRKKYVELRRKCDDLPGEEQTESWDKIVDAELDILTAMPKQAKALDEVREDIAKLLQIMKKYVS